MTDQLNEDPTTWETGELVAFLEKAALAYRQGTPLIEDDLYDHVYLAELCKRDPEHPFLHQVEAEPDYGAGRLKHPEPMLSTEKSYSIEETRKWVKRIQSEAKKQGIDVAELRVMVTAKLDGLAAMLREDGRLVTRGDGAYGNDISSAFDKGVVDVGNGAPGVGELVMVESYFEQHLKAAGYAHPRNVCVGIVNSDEINADFKQALAAGMVRFVPYATLEKWQGSLEELLNDHDAIQQQVRESCDYPIDGVVAEITDEKLKTLLGSTSHHNRWQIAIKQRAVAKQTTVKSISWQTGRTGRVTPVLGVEPIELSGAIVSRITAHHAGNVRALGLGEGAVITAERSGEVIPKIVAVVESAKKTTLPKKCPSCEHELVWEGDFLTCVNHLACPAQIKNTLEHFFRTHGQVDGFGPRSIDKLVEAGIDTLQKIYASTEEDFIKAGFGEGQSKNLRRELNRSLSVQIEDWRLLAAFGIARLGKGDSRRLLQGMRLEHLASVTEEEIIRIDGFAGLSAGIIVAELKEMWPKIEQMLELGFKLEETPLLSEADSIESPIAGMKIVFTGKMLQASRDEMKKQAMQLGAKVQSAVSSTTDLLVCGENVGAAKTGKAEKLGVRVVTEAEYVALLK
jgi:DNA ligase (NAD+)